MKMRGRISIWIIALMALAIWATKSDAFPTYSDPARTRSSGNCADCHGDFLATGYVSKKDGTAWRINGLATSLHEGHRTTMLNARSISGSCEICHTLPNQRPVFLGSSSSTLAGFSPIACAGCHGREGDMGHDFTSPGRGAGLRQHHLNAGVGVCADCHDDVFPSVYKPVAENIPPAFYFPEASRPQKPTDPCNANGSESIVAPPLGLDNDGDLLNDAQDSDCRTVAAINLNPAALDFGQVFIGNQATLSAQIQNFGNAALVVNSIARSAGTSGELTFTAPATPFTIPVGGSQAVTVTYTPTNVGADTGSLTIASNDPANPTVNLNLAGSGAVVPAPAISLNPAALDFGTVLTGSSSSLSAQVQNLGNANLNVSLINLCTGTSTEFSFTVPVTSFALAPGASQAVTVTYTPTNVGTDTGCLAIASNDPNNPTVNLNLTGTGQQPIVLTPAINLNPAALDFGQVFIGTKAAMTAQIQNLGNAALVVNSIAPSAGTSGEFSLTVAPPFTVPVGGSQAVTVIYTPVNVGADSGSLVIASNDPKNPTVNLNLKGSGAVVPAPVIGLNPTALNFGTVLVGSSLNLATQVQNLGNADLNVTLINLCAGTSTEFAFAASATPFPIAAGASQTVTVSYTPMDAGTDVGCLAIASNDPNNSTVNVNLTGTGQQPIVLVPAINLNPAALDFGQLFIGNQAAMTAQIQNLGNADLVVNSITPSAGTSGEFSLTLATPFTIPVGGSQAVTVTYTPVNVGSDSGSLVIASNDPKNPTVNLSLKGSGATVPTPVISLNPAALNFGTAFVGSSLNLNIQVQNQGNADLTVNSINRCSGTSTEYTFTAPVTPITLAPGAGQTVMVTYTPTNTGTDTGCLAIASNDPKSPTVNLQLTGTGAVAGLVKSLTIKEAKWDNEDAQLEVKGTVSPSGTVVNITDADTGAQLGSVTSRRDGTWRLIVVLDPVSAPCRVRAAAGTLVVESAVENSRCSEHDD